MKTARKGVSSITANRSSLLEEKQEPIKGNTLPSSPNAHEKQTTQTNTSPSTSTDSSSICKENPSVGLNEHHSSTSRGSNENPAESSKNSTVQIPVNVRKRL